MTDANKKGIDLDNASASRPLTHRQKRMALERAKDPNSPEGAIARRSGFASSTSRNPRYNGLDSQEFLDRLVATGELSPSQAKSIGLKVLAGLAEDPEQPGGTRGAAAKTLMEYGTTCDEFEDHADTIATGALWLDLQTRRALIVGMRLGLNRSASRVLASVERLERERDEIRARLAQLQAGA